MPNVRKPSAPELARFLLEGAAGSTYSRKQTHLRGFKAFGIFLLFGAAMAGLAGATTDLAQPFPRSSVGVERTGIPPARTLREWRGRGLPGARRRSGDGRSRLVPSPVLRLGLGSCPGRNPERGERGERHPGRFPAGGSRVGSCGRDTLFSSPSASANRFPKKGFSRPSNRVSLYLYVNPGVGHPRMRYFALLDFTLEKCEHLSLLGSKIHT